MAINPYEPSRVPQPHEPEVVAYEEGRPIDYDLTLDDFVAFNIDYSRRTPFYKAVVGGTAIALATAAPVVVAIYLLRSDNVSTETALWLVVFATINTAVVGVAAWWTMRQRGSSFLSAALFKTMIARGDTSSLVGRYSIRLTAAEIIERAPKSETRHAITAIQKLILTAEHLFIYVSPIHAYVVPLRAFGNHTEAEGFVTALQKYSNVHAVRDDGPSAKTISSVGRR